MQSTKYRYLKSGENVLPSDEIRLGDKWVVAGESCLLGKNTEVSELAERGMWYRRRLPHSGNTQFLMTVSIMVPVIVNCDGKTQGEIEDEAGQLAVGKILSNPREYVHFENIDWGACKVDEIQPEPKNPGKYRMLEVGETIENGDQFLAGDWWDCKEEDMVSIDYAVGDKVTADIVGDVRRPITEPQYRPFLKSDVVEEGDQVNHKGVWYPFCNEIYGQTIDAGLVSEARKLIK